MRAKGSLAGVMLILCVLLPGVADAACFFVGAFADGRILGPYSLSSASDDISLEFRPEAGRSYSVDIITSRGPSGAGAAALVLNIDTAFCPTTDVSTGFTLRNTSSITPSTCCGHARRSIVASVAASFLEVRVHNSDASASDVLVSVTETTMFSPAWSTNGTYDTFYSFQNTTNSTCNVTLTLFDTAGSAITTASNAIASAATFSTNTSALGTTRNLTGTAKLTHDCPPGGIQAEAAIANFSLSPTPYIQIVKFQPVRAAR